MKHSELRQIIREEIAKTLNEEKIGASGLNDKVINNSKIYFYGLKLKDNQRGFSSYGIKLFKSLDQNNLTYSIWGFGEETKTVNTHIFISSVEMYKHNGNDINDALSSANNSIKNIEAKIEESEKYIEFLTNHSKKPQSERKRLIASSKKSIEFYDSIIKDIKSLKK